jgi:N-acetylglucosaminyldiphosphoundecaprenol N-acetyl-beta-D-mannosaminyltransferase
VNLKKPVVFPVNMLPKAPIKPGRANVLGVGIHAVNLQTAIEFVENSIRSQSRGYVCVTGVHGVMEANRDLEFRRILDSALLVLPDGMPTVWVGRYQKHREMKRVFGPDFMSEVCSRSAKNGYSHFLYGGKPGVAEDLQRCLENKHPGINIVGTFTPPFRPLNAQEQNSLAETIAVLRPDIVWVGLSTPKQERFMAEMVGRLDCKLMIGVGAAFDIHTNRINDAPAWMKNTGLQWMHRLCQEPGRLWKRYLINNSMFLWNLGLQFAGLRRVRLIAEPQLSQGQQ